MLHRRQFLMGLVAVPVMASVPVILSSETVVAKEIELSLSEQLKRLMTETFQAQVNFEVNDKEHRDYFRYSLNNKLKSFVYNRKIRDYVIVCDERNNPLSIVNNSGFVAELSYRENLSPRYNRITLTSEINSIKFEDIV